MSKFPQPQPGLLSIAPYVPGKSAVKKGVESVKLSANESPLGASPKAVEAYLSVAGQLAIYPDGRATKLRQALAEVHGLNADQLVIGAGSDELLHLLAQTYLGEGDEAIVTEFGFLVYPIVTLGAGATPVVVKDHDYTVDVDAILAAVTGKTKIVWLANPNNPTGTYLPDAEVRRLHASLRSDILLVVDNAYAEYAVAEDYTDGAALAAEAQNVVMVRTFSKMGLAGARVGWMYACPAIVDAVDRLRGPFNVSAPAQAAAEAAVRDVAFTQQLSAHNAQWRDWLSVELASNAVRVLPSQGNFILVLFDETEGCSAAGAFEYLAEHGLIVREMGGYGVSNGLRISVGSEEVMHKLADVLRDYVRGAC